MAGDWIKMRTDLKEDPAVYKIAEILNIDELQAIGALFCFWAWADKHCVDGHVDGATSRLVDRVSLINGFTDALVSVGWLSVDDSGIQIPKFERHNGDSAKARTLKTERQAKWRRNKDSDVDGDASTKTSTRPSTREEKRREEVNTNKPPVADLFDRFWRAYPKKVGKDAAKKAFDKRKPDESLLSSMLAAVAIQSNTNDWMKNDGQFIPHPSTWLNEGRWQDEVTAGDDGGDKPEWMRGAI